jgi:hypothetical protein
MFDFLIAVTINFVIPAYGQKVTTGFIVDAIIELVQVADLQCNVLSGLVYNCNLTSVSFEVRFMIGEKELVVRANLIFGRSVIAFSKIIGNSNAIPKAIAIPCGCES